MPLETANTHGISARSLSSLEHKTERVHLIMPLWPHFLGEQSTASSPSSIKNKSRRASATAGSACSGSLAFHSHGTERPRSKAGHPMIICTKRFVDPKRKTENPNKDRRGSIWCQPTACSVCVSLMGGSAIAMAWMKTRRECAPAMLPFWAAAAVVGSLLWRVRGPHLVATSKARRSPWLLVCARPLHARACGRRISVPTGHTTNPPGHPLI